VPAEHRIVNVKLLVHTVTTGLLGHSVFASHVRLLQSIVFSQVFRQNFDITLFKIKVSLCKEAKSVFSKVRTCDGTQASKFNKHLKLLCMQVATHTQSITVSHLTCTFLPLSVLFFQANTSRYRPVTGNHAISKYSTQCSWRRQHYQLQTTLSRPRKRAEKVVSGS
jgi:hypothetical protein